MARRRQSEPGVNLDSLLDTLTNVIGFLLILLALMKLSVGEAVERIRVLDPETFGVTADDLENARRRAERAAQVLTAVEGQAQSLSQEMQLLKVAAGPDAKKDDSEAMSAARAEAALKQLKSQKQSLERKAIITEAELERLKDRIAKLPQPRALPGKTVRLPDPRPAPEGMQAFWILCKNERVVPVDIGEIREAVKRRVTSRRMVAQLKWRPPPEARSRGGFGQVNPALADKKDEKPKAQPELIFDPDKTRALFDQRPLLTRDLSVTLKTFDDRDTANLLLDVRQFGGEAVDKLKQPESRFREAVAEAKEKNRYFRFMVTPESYDAYLEARALADEQNIPCGWEILNRDEWEVGLGGIVKFHQKVEKPPPPPKSDQPQPQRPPPKVID